MTLGWDFWRDIIGWLIVVAIGIGGWYFAYRQNEKLQRHYFLLQLTTVGTQQMIRDAVSFRYAIIETIGFITIFKNYLNQENLSSLQSSLKELTELVDCVYETSSFLMRTGQHYSPFIFEAFHSSDFWPKINSIFASKISILRFPSLFEEPRHEIIKTVKEASDGLWEIKELVDQLISDLQKDLSLKMDSA